jgi:hypothetical protein
MSMWQSKSEAQLKSMLADDEKVIKVGDGQIGLKPAFLALTNRRVFIFRMGTTVASPPRMAEVNLEHITSAHCNPGIMTKGPTLVIKSRTGTFDMILTKTARRESGMWPKWILEAQSSLDYRRQSSDDVASRLAQVTALHESGALTPDEFAAAKSRILGTAK